MSGRTFLLEECRNLREVLDETLRFEFSDGDSENFFNECTVRLQFLESEFESCSDDLLQEYATSLNELSHLISRLEKTSLDQYSWPFVEELKRISAKACSENTSSDDQTIPMMYVLSDGGLDAYSIYTEDPGLSVGDRRILTIKFPRTLKHYVLLHSILGHEIGHAIWRNPKNDEAITTIISKYLSGADSKFCKQENTLAWLKSDAAPTQIVEQLAELTLDGLKSEEFFDKYAKWKNWREEIVCDLIGLLIFGPAFVASFIRLLTTVDIDGHSINEDHPLPKCRINLVLNGASQLGYNKNPFVEDNLKSAFDKFWAEQNSYRTNAPWYEVLSDAEISDLITALRKLLMHFEPILYPEIDDPGQFEKLYKQVVSGIPPNGFEIKPDGQIKNSKVDFRHILYAGWLSSLNSPMSFKEINRLCEKGILQQKAIDIFSAA